MGWRRSTWPGISDTDYQGIDPEATDRGNTGGFGAGSEYFSEYYNAAPPRVFILNFTVNF